MDKITKVNSIKLSSDVHKKKNMLLFQDLGILGFLLAVFAGAITIATSNPEYIIEYIIMYTFTIIAVIFVVYKFRYIAVAVAGLQILIYTVYKIYQSVANHQPILWQSYLWIFIPIISVGALQLFLYHNFRIEQINELINNQLGEVALLDSLTGLYNQRALFIDLQRQMAYSVRHNDTISLVSIQLRYYDELRSVLSKTNFDRLIQKLGSIIEDNVRLEDRCYSTNSDNGSFSAMLICNKAGAVVVSRRIRAMVQNKEAFTGIVDKAIRVEIKVGICEYDKETIHDAIEFKQKTDNELQYDV